MDAQFLTLHRTLLRIKHCWQWHQSSDFLPCELPLCHSSHGISNHCDMALAWHAPPVTNWQTDRQMNKTLHWSWVQCYNKSTYRASCWPYVVSYPHWLLLQQAWLLSSVFRLPTHGRKLFNKKNVKNHQKLRQLLREPPLCEWLLNRYEQLCWFANSEKFLILVRALGASSMSTENLCAVHLCWSLLRHVQHGTCRVVGYFCCETCNFQSACHVWQCLPW